MSKHNKHKNHTKNNITNNIPDIDVVCSIAIIDPDEPIPVSVNDEFDVDESGEVLLNISTTESVTDQSDIVENEIDTVEDIKNDESIEKPVEEIDDEFIIENSIIDTNDKSCILEPVQPVNFYRVGTGVVNNKCINQITATSDLAIAKEICINARDTSKKSFHVFDKLGNAVYTAEYTIPKDNYYRVGTDWKNGVCINQKMAAIDFERARDFANKTTMKLGVIHHVYDPSGRIVFSAKKKLLLLTEKKRGIKNADWYS